MYAAHLLPCAHRASRRKFRFLFVPTNRKLFTTAESAEGALFNPNFSLKEWLNMYW